MSSRQQLPHWDMTAVYHSLQSPEFEADFGAMGAELDRLTELFDQYHVGMQAAGASDSTEDRSFELIIGQYTAVAEKLFTLGAYIRSFTSTDSFDNLAQARLSEMQQNMVSMSQLSTRLTAWIGSLDIEGLIETSELARELAFVLRKERIQSTHLMSPPEESLAAHLNPTGGSAWGKLHSTITSQLLVQMGDDKGDQLLPMSVVRNMAYDPDRNIRQRAYIAEIDAWERAAVPLAAALNSVKGETNTLELRRGWPSALDVALFDNNIDRQTLDAMMEAAHASFPDFRRYLQAKAQILDLPALTWYDLFAPVGASTTEWDYESAKAFLLDQFGSYSTRLRDFVDRAFRENWIDAEPRPGKVGGAFCMWIRGDESRVLTNYMQSYDGVSTLAHELGHAYHNFNLAGRSIMARQTPMALAETASIFCETITEHAALEKASAAEQLAILESSIGSSCQVVVDITSRFLFEQSVFEGRLKRELSVEELNESMLHSQSLTYGDGLDEKVRHPYMWAVKGHYYSSGRPFYNFPYMFGLLFGLGLYARYQMNPEAFRTGYDDLLSSTGLWDAATLAEKFDIDIRTPDFWHSSLDIVRDNINRFVDLASIEAH